MSRVIIIPFMLKYWIKKKVIVYRMAGDRAEQPQVKHDKRIPAKRLGLTDTWGISEFS